MKVQVTKDHRGIIVWTADAKLYFGNLFKDKLPHSKNTWLQERFTFRSKKVFDVKEATKMFPKLVKNMEEGTKRDMTLALR